MIDLDVLARRGVSAEAWQKIFTKPEMVLPIHNPWNQQQPAPSGAKSAALVSSEAHDIGGWLKDLGGGAGEFRNRVRLRIMEGREYNFQNWQLYKGLDDALDAPLTKAVTPTLLSRLQDKTGTQESLEKELTSFGLNLNDVVWEVPDSKVPGKNIRRVSAPAFFQIFVPLVKAYLTIRRAKIMNDLGMTPFFAYQPAWESARSRMQCDVITSRVETMSTQMGYWDVVDEGVFKMLHYGRAWQFPVEEWFSEEQIQAGEDKPKVVKSGLRYHFPHPTRVFWDQAYAAHTFNTGTGCRYAGYWRVFRYRDIYQNKDFWNRDRIFIGNYGWYSLQSLFFQSVYPCVMAYPWPPAMPTNDRETKLVEFVYTKDMGDKPIVLTEYFEKFVPKEFDLGNYDHPIWARFVVAGDDTVIYGAPLPYDPVIYWHYDEDPARLQNSSMSLEILPWQDHLGNLLTQYLLTIKANLANVTFVDEDLVEKKFLDQIRNLGEKLFRTRNFIPFSGRKFRAAQQQPPQAFFSHNFPHLDVNGITEAMRLILDLVERVLQMSSQEVGAAASHEQTKAEVVAIGRQTSTRLDYTMAPVHHARHAMMRQLYLALMAYDDEEFWAQIPYDRSITPEQLKELGFTYDEKKHPRRQHDRNMVVKASKAALIVESFAQLRSSEDRQDTGEVALALLQSLDRLLMGPLGPAIGAEQAIQMVNLAGRLAGWPRDFKLKNMTPAQTPEQQAEAVRQQLSGYINEIEQKILGEVKEGLKPMLENDAKQNEAIDHMTQILGMANKFQAPAGMLQPPPGPPGMPPPPPGPPPPSAPPMAPDNSGGAMPIPGL